MRRDEPHFVVLDGRRIDTTSHEWIVICLARYICRLPTKDDRHQFLAKLRWEPKSIDELKEIIKAEWARMYPKKEQNEVAAHDNA